MLLDIIVCDYSLNKWSHMLNEFILETRGGAGEIIEEMKSYAHQLYEFIYYMNIFIIWIHMLDEFTDNISVVYMFIN